MPGVAQVWLTQEELTALLLAATNKGTILSPRMEEAIVPKLDAARNQLGCPVPRRTAPELEDARPLKGQVTLEEAISWAEIEEAQPIYGGY